MQLKTRANSKMGDHLGSIHFAFLNLPVIGRNIGKISKILLFSWSFEKNSITYKLTQFSPVDFMTTSRYPNNLVVRKFSLATGDFGKFAKLIGN